MPIVSAPSSTNAEQMPIPDDHADVLGPDVDPNIVPDVLEAPMSITNSIPSDFTGGIATPPLGTTSPTNSGATTPRLPPTETPAPTVIPPSLAPSQFDELKKMFLDSSASAAAANSALQASIGTLSANVGMSLSEFRSSLDHIHNAHVADFVDVKSQIQSLTDSVAETRLHMRDFQAKLDSRPPPHPSPPQPSPVPASSSVAPRGLPRSRSSHSPNIQNDDHASKPQCVRLKGFVCKFPKRDLEKMDKKL